MTELKHAFLLRHRLHIFVMVGGSLLLVTGLTMGYLNNALFNQLWYVTSLVLFLIALSFGPFLLKPASTPIKKLLHLHKGENIPSEYYVLEKKLVFYERIENTIFLIIIALMVLKPVNFQILLKLFYLQ